MALLRNNAPEKHSCLFLHGGGSISGCLVKSGQRVNLVIYTAWWHILSTISYHLGGAENLHPHLLLANTLVGFIALAPNDKFWGVCRSFSICAPEQRQQLLRARDSSKKWACPPLLELLVVSSVILADSLSLPWTASLKWSGSELFPNSGGLIYLGFFFQGDLSESIAVRLINI
jgi:hypothetical protein